MRIYPSWVHWAYRQPIASPAASLTPHLANLSWQPLSRLAALTWFNLEGCNLGPLPLEFAELRSLVYLNLSNNKLLSYLGQGSEAAAGNAPNWMALEKLENLENLENLTAWTRLDAQDCWLHAVPLH